MQVQDRRFSVPGDDTSHNVEQLVFRPERTRGNCRMRWEFWNKINLRTAGVFGRCTFVTKRPLQTYVALNSIILMTEAALSSETNILIYTP